jgi:hypothetical protein
VAVYELNGGQLLRVARSIDGELHQYYYSLIGLNKTQQRQARKEARALDEDWKARQAHARSKRIRGAETDAGHSTGVRGINVVRRPSAAFRVQVQIEGKSHVREFSVKRLGAGKAWNQATRFLAQCRGFKTVPKAWASRMPDID